MILHPLADVVTVVGVEVVVVVVVAVAAVESTVDLSSRDVVDNDSTVDLLSSRESSKLVKLLVLDSSAASAGVFGSNLLLFFGSFGITKSSSSIASPLLRCCLLH